MPEIMRHPQQLVAMVADAIKDVSRRGGVVLDLFGGSGSTLIAAHRTGRRARLCEFDPIYCDRILSRWETFARDDAERIACGLSPARSGVATSGWENDAGDGSEAMGGDNCSSAQVKTQESREVIPLNEAHQPPSYQRSDHTDRLAGAAEG
jgi:hypothetical protein